MKRLNLVLLAVLASLTLGLSSCEAIAGIFKAGVWTGVILVAALVGLVIFIIAKASGKK